MHCRCGPNHPGPLFGRFSANKSIPFLDGAIHLAYVMMFTNKTSVEATVEKIEVLDARDNKPSGTNWIVMPLTLDELSFK